MRMVPAALCFAALLAAAPAAAADTEVDLELVFAVDVSRSMDLDEQELQRRGYVDGIQHPEVLGAIRSGMTGRIAATYVEWAGPGSQQVAVPWMLIDGPESAAEFAGKMRAVTISRFHGTSISGALTFSAGLFDGNGFQGMREVIDVSGDGPNNMGQPVLESREAVLARGATINGLPIMLKTRNDNMFSISALDDYYEDCVIGGPGAFLITVTSMDRFAEAIRRKMVLEIAGVEPRLMRAAMTKVQASDRPPADCMIGEKLRQRWMRD